MGRLDHSQQQALLIRSDIPTKRYWFLGSCLVIVLALLPVYAFSSGGFQLVDIPLFFIIAGTFFVRESEKDRDILKNIYYLIPFAVWVILVNGIYFIAYGNNWFLVGTIPVIYAIFLMYTFYNIFTKLIRENDIKYIYIGLILSIILCFTVKGYSEEGRAILSFNDPNQLGYFAVLILSYVIILLSYKAEYKINKFLYTIMDIVIIIAAHFFLFLSLSRSTMAAFIFLDICLLKNIKNSRQILQISMAILLMTVFILFLRPNFIQERMATRGTQFEEKNMAENLKTRLLKPFAHFEGTDFLFGQGSGTRSNKTTMAGLKVSQTGIEVHNMFGEVFREFGLIGLSLYLFWLIKFILCVRGVKDSFWVLAGIFTFNMAINGMRWRAFWIFLAFLLAMAGLYKRDREHPKSPA